MALITRCPHCTTTFRVTPPHLQAHGGDVRCGRCAQVFNAFSTLSTIQEPGGGDPVTRKTEGAPENARNEKPAWESPALAASGQAEPPPAPSHEITQTEALADTVTPEAGIAETAVLEDVIQETPAPEKPAPEAIIPEAPISETVMPQAGGASTATADLLPHGLHGQPLGQPISEPSPAERFTEEPATVVERLPGGSATDAASASEKIHAPGSSEPETRANDAHAAKAHAQQVHAKEPTQEAGPPETREVHEHEVQAENYAFDAAQPRQTSVVWTFANLLLLILLTGQTVYFYRTELAALVPAAKPYLEQYCQLLQCTISPLRHPQLLNIESSDMHADDPQRPGVITLSATVRNHASYPQAFPLFELTFIDNQNKPLASRIFKPDAYLGENASPTGNISAGTEFDVRLHLDTGDLNADGYRLSLLYPGS